MSGHEFNPYGVCRRCGCGRSAASHPCEPGGASGSRNIGSDVDPRARPKSEQEPGTHPKRSVFLGSLAGYAIASAMGVIVVIALVIGAGKFKAASSQQVLVSVGALGAYAGYVITVRRGKAQGARSPYHDWSKFITSGMAFGIGMIVIAGSSLLTLLIWLAHNAISGKGG
jgi:hypothetical protein